MKRKTIQTGLYQVNTSVLDVNGQAWIVDPGSEGERIIKLIEGMGLVDPIVLLTHAHFDHIGALPYLEKRYPALAVYVHPEDEKIIDHPLNVYPPEYPPIKRPADLRDVSGLKGVETIFTPGHTPGGCCYLFREEKLLFSGDTLFAGSIGRTDLPGGSAVTLMDSLEKLKALDPEIQVVPGHGMETSIGFEKRMNPYLLG